MKSVAVALLLATALLAQRGGFGGRGFGGGFRGGAAGYGRGPAMGRGLVGGHGGGGFRIGIGGHHFRSGFGQFPGYRHYVGGYRFSRNYASYFVGYGGLGFYSPGYYGWPYWNNFTYGTAPYAYPYGSGPAVSVVTVPGPTETGPVISITNGFAAPDKRGGSAEGHIEKRANEQPQPKNQPLRSPIYLIAVTEGTIWAALSYSVEDGKLNFITTRGDRKSLPLSEIDRALTTELNAQAGIIVRLP
jgi:hypothetical protein